MLLSKQKKNIKHTKKSSLCVHVALFLEHEAVALTQVFGFTYVYSSGQSQTTRMNLEKQIIGWLRFFFLLTTNLIMQQLERTNNFLLSHFHSLRERQLNSSPLYLSAVLKAPQKEKLMFTSHFNTVSGKKIINEKSYQEQWRSSRSYFFLLVF